MSLHPPLLFKTACQAEFLTLKVFRNWGTITPPLFSFCSGPVRWAQHKAGISAGALEDALIREKIIPKVHGFVIRSDNGLVFGSKRFHETVTKYQLHQEYITPYTPEQNGMIERFFKSFKEECAWQHNFVSFDEAYNKIADWIDYYNFQRPHSALGYATPAEVRNKLVA